MDGKFNTTILVAPLDWGLGHAARCIPIIRYLDDIGCKVLIATEGAQKKLLQIEFPDFEFINLNGYRVKYASNKRLLPIKIMLQLPGILLSIKKEHEWLQSLTDRYHIHAVVSDNRYGLWHKKIPAIIITHQLNVRVPSFLQTWLTRLHYFFINRFSGCWVPDVEESPGIAGQLSHPLLLPKTLTRYIGGLSRFKRHTAQNRKYDLLIVISGPEPQRTIFEKILLKDCVKLEKKVLFVRGLPAGDGNTVESLPDITIVNHLRAVDLNQAFEQSDLIVSRSGYTTVMDILRLKKKSILIPTPGQTEQEYLAKHLKEQRWCLSYPQQKFNIIDAIEHAEKFAYELPDLDMDQYKKTISEFVGSLSAEA